MGEYNFMIYCVLWCFENFDSFEYLFLENIYIVCVFGFFFNNWKV